MLILLDNRENLLTLKSQISDDTVADEDELQDRKRNRKILVLTASLSRINLILILLSVLLSSEEFVMPIYSQADYIEMSLNI